MKTRYSLIVRLIFGAALALGLPLLTALKIYLDNAQQEAIQAARFVYREWVGSAINEMERESLMAVIALHALSNTPEVRSLFYAPDYSAVGPHIERRLESFIAANPHYSGVAILDNSFSILSAVCQLGNSELSAANWQDSFRDPQQPLGTMTQFPVHLQKVQRIGASGFVEPNMRFLLPIYNRFNEISGLLALDFPMSSWAYMLAQRYQEHRFVLFDHQGNLLASNLPDLHNETAVQWLRILLNDPIDVRRLRQGDAVIKYNGSDALLVTSRFSPPAQADFFLQFAAVVPFSELLAPIYRLRTTAFALGLLLLVIGIVIAALYIIHVVRPLSDLAAQLRNMDPRAPKPIPDKALQSEDEVGLIARSLLSLQQQLQSSFRALDGKIDELEKTNVALSKAKVLAEAAATAKADFLSVMSHEIRTPLNAIVGYAQLLRYHKVEQDEVLEFTQRIMQSSDRLLELIDRILDYTRLNAGTTELQLSPIIVSELLNSLAVDAGLLFDPQRVAFRTEIDDSCRAIYKVDRMRLGQVISNLLNNAAKFTRDGQVVLRAGVDSDAELQPLLKVTVQDTGIGIDPDKQALVFQPFVQVDNSQKRKYQGAGLGLAIVAKLTKLMQGSIRCQSIPGEGSTFTLVVPLLWNDDEVDTVALQSVPTAANQGFAKLRVVAAEDDSSSAEVLRNCLQALGVGRVTVFESGSALIQELKRFEYDVVILDLHLGDEDGIEIAKVIRAGGAGAQNQSLPILALTAFTDPSFAVRAKNVDINRLMHKPLSMNDLQQFLASV